MQIITHVENVFNLWIMQIKITIVYTSEPIEKIQDFE